LGHQKGRRSEGQIRPGEQSGAERRKIGKARAQRLVEEGLRALGWKEAELCERAKGRRADLWPRLIRAIANDPLPFRPGRTEPRAVKRRPKAYALLNKPRKQFKEIRHRSRYRKYQIIKK
jgi:hypothetical protein